MGSYEQVQGQEAALKDPSIAGELRKQARLAVPATLTNLLGRSLVTVSLIWIGKIPGDVPLAAAALANTTTNVFGSPDTSNRLPFSRRSSTAFKRADTDAYGGATPDVWLSYNVCRTVDHRRFRHCRQHNLRPGLRRRQLRKSRAYRAAGASRLLGGLHSHQHRLVRSSGPPVCQQKSGPSLQRFRMSAGGTPKASYCCAASRRRSQQAPAATSGG